MGVFHVFKITQLLRNCATHHIWFSSKKKTHLFDCNDHLWLYKVFFEIARWCVSSGKSYFQQFNGKKDDFLETLLYKQKDTFRQLKAKTPPKSLNTWKLCLRTVDETKGKLFFNDTVMSLKRFSVIKRYT